MMPRTPSADASNTHRLRFRGAVLALAAALLLPAQATAAPQRIASIYLCADQLLLQLADRSRIVSLFRLIVDPEMSTMPDAAEGIHLNRGRAEDILPLKPDLVFAGEHTVPATRALLRRLGIPVVDLPLASDFDGIRSNIMRVANAVGEPQRGRRLVESFDSRLAAMSRPDPAGLSALLYRSGSFIHGQGTLIDAMLTAAGFTNHVAALEEQRLALESLLLDPPDVFVTGAVGSRTSLAAETMVHPAVRRMLATRPSIDLPDPLWLCDLPAAAAEAVERLASFHTALRDGRYTGGTP